MAWRTFLVMSGLVALAACSANHNAVFRQSTLPSNGANLVTIDAKQRTLLTSTVSVPVQPPAGGTATPVLEQRFCAEPSPDVYSVMAQALSAGGRFGESADPASVETALNAAFSSAEQGSTIPRTQTVNLLRELMYRTCERYLSGGYDSAELSVQAIRDQRLMVSILAIEQLTGAVTPRPVVISASGSAASGATGDAIVRLDDARKARDKARTDAATAEEAYDQANGADKVCDAIKDKAEADLTEAQKPKVAPCNQALSTWTSAQEERAIRAANYDVLSRLAATGGVSAATTVAANAPGGLDTVRPGDVSAVTTAVREIVGLNMSDSSEIMMFCLRALNGGGGVGTAITSSSTLSSTCIEFLRQNVALAASRLAHQQSLIAEVTESRNSIESASNTYFKDFWTPARATAMATPEGRAALVARLKQSLLPRDAGKADCFANASTEALALGCFGPLGPAVQSDPAWQGSGS